MAGGGVALYLLGDWVRMAAPGQGAATLDALPQALGYLPLYAGGILLGRHPVLCAPATRDWRIPAILATGLLALGAWAGPASAGSHGEAALLVRIAIRSGVTVAASLLILRSALSVAAVPPAVRGVSDAALTIYIVHFPIIRVLDAVAGGAIADDHLRFAFVAGVGGVASLAVHHGVVARSPILLWMFNGRARRRSTPATPAGTIA